MGVSGVRVEGFEGFSGLGCKVLRLLGFMVLGFRVSDFTGEGVRVYGFSVRGLGFRV